MKIPKDKVNEIKKITARVWNQYDDTEIPNLEAETYQITTEDLLTLTDFLDSFKEE